MAVNETKNNDPTYLTVGIKDFGPISSGKIKLKPLTILIGPNNSGKSYSAIVINSLFCHFDHDNILRLNPSQFITKENRNLFLAEISLPDLKKQLLKKGIFEIPSSTACFLEKNIFDKFIDNNFITTLYKSFGSFSDNFIKNVSGHFNLRFLNSNIDFHVKSNEAIIVKRPCYEMLFEIRSSEFGNSAASFIRHDKIVVQMTDLFLKNIDSFSSNSLFDLITRSFLINLSYSYNFLSHHYLSAARLGLLQSHKILTYNIYKDIIPTMGTETAYAPMMPGLDSEFMASISSIEPKKKMALHDMAKEMEIEMTGGEILFSFHPENKSPDIFYTINKALLPLHTASSSVSSLAPLILFLKYKVQPGDVLTIEEPEAHLHPANQRILAKYLVRLIRKGVKLILTTHSDYLVSQLSNFILLNKVSPAKRKKLKYTKDDYLSPDEVSVNVFKYDRKSKGFKISEVEIDEDEGILEKEFNKISESLYDETFELNKIISKQNKTQNDTSKKD